MIPVYSGFVRFVLPSLGTSYASTELSLSCKILVVQLKSSLTSFTLELYATLGTLLPVAKLVSFKVAQAHLSGIFCTC